MIIRGKVKEHIDKNQRDYILREELKVIREELGDDAGAEDADGYLEQLEKLNADKETKEKIKKRSSVSKACRAEARRQMSCAPISRRSSRMPWKKTSRDNQDIIHAKEVLEEDHYGLEQVKDRVLNSLRSAPSQRKAQARSLCLVGPPGTGKTSIARSVARALERSM